LRQDHAVAIANRVDAVQLATAAFLQTQPPLPVFTWNDDFARPLAYDMSLNVSSAYERHEDRGIVRNRFDSVGRSIVQADSFVVLLPGDDEWTRPTAPEAWWTLAWEMPGQVQVYRVPATPPAIGGLTPLTALAPLGIGVSIQAAGQSSAVVLPERSLILAVAFDHPAPSAFALRAATNCAGRSPGRSVTVPFGATDARLELPVDAAANGQPVTCALQVAGPDDRWATVGQVDVAALLVDEPEGRYTLARPPDGTGGWQATYQPFVRGGGAVIAVAP
jgi:hypothetical protein